VLARADAVIQFSFFVAVQSCFVPPSGRTTVWISRIGDSLWETRDMSGDLTHVLLLAGEAALIEIETLAPGRARRKNRCHAMLLI
jgi:hypothetical protein